MCLKMLRVAVVLLWSFPAWAQAEGIQFYKAVVCTDLLAKAKTEQKLIFLNAFTTWSGYCNSMNTNVFAQKKVRDFYNTNFINVKMDMERGVGLELAQTYNIQAYPTFLFLNGDGKVIHQAVGQQEASAFLKIGRTALDPQKNFAALEKRLDAGERDPQFISRLLQAFADALHPRTDALVKIYLQMHSNWNTPEMIRLLVKSTQQTDSEQFKYLIKNRFAFEKEVGKRVYLNIVQRIVLKDALKKPEKLPLDSIRSILYTKLPQSLAAQLFLELQMNQYQYNREFEKYSAAAVEYYSTYPSNDLQELNAIAWTFYEQVSDPDQLKVALRWAAKSVALNSFSFNNETLAALYYKLGDRVNAKKTIEKAIELAKANHENYSSAVELLAKIDRME